jgi:surfactin synthase thioesterase subunit
MALKQTHIYRGHAIVHQVFSTDQTEEKIERFTVSVPGKGQLCTKSTLMEAKQSVDEILAAPAHRSAANSR